MLGSHQDGHIHHGRAVLWIRVRRRARTWIKGNGRFQTRPFTKPFLNQGAQMWTAIGPSGNSQSIRGGCWCNGIGGPRNNRVGNPIPVIEIFGHRRHEPSHLDTAAADGPIVPNFRADIVRRRPLNLIAIPPLESIRISGTAVFPSTITFYFMGLF